MTESVSKTGMTRVTGDFSLHAEHKPDLCTGDKCGPWRVVDCCKRHEDMDVVECAKCGLQKVVGCSFDEDMS